MAAPIFFKWTCVIPLDQMHMTLPFDFEKIVSFVLKFALKLCNLPDFGPSSGSSSRMKLFRKNHVTPHLHKWNGLFSVWNADELVCLADAMQMNWMQCRWIARTIYQNNKTKYSELLDTKIWNSKRSRARKIGRRTLWYRNTFTI